MSPDRRYSEKEIAEIFEQATKAQEAAHNRLSHREGLTLAELQRIGKDVGITPEFVAHAASGLDRVRETAPTTRLMGMPISVAHTVDLTAPLTDSDWDRLVIDLQETFHARGETHRDGALRSWSNGNLTVIAEPTEVGHRLRFRSLKGSASSTVFGSMMALVMGLVIFLSVFASSDPMAFRQLIPIALFLFAGLGTFGGLALHLRNWTALRDGQFREIAERAQDRITKAPRPQKVVSGAKEIPALDLDALVDPAGPNVNSAPESLPASSSSRSKA